MTKTKNTSPQPEAGDLTVPVGWAVSAIMAALLVSFGLFVSPLFIAVKSYVFMGICILAAFLVRFYKWYLRRAASPSAKLAVTDKISLGVVLVLMAYSGVFKFTQYWMPGGSEPFFHDMTVAYIAGLFVLILVWAVALLVSATEQTFVSVIRSFRFWAFGYIGMFVLMVIMLIIYEGD